MHRKQINERSTPSSRSSCIAPSPVWQLLSVAATYRCQPVSSYHPKAFGAGVEGGGFCASGELGLSEKQSELHGVRWLNGDLLTSLVASPVLSCGVTVLMFDILDKRLGPLVY